MDVPFFLVKNNYINTIRSDCDLYCLDVSQLLIAQGADIDAQSVHGHTPLMDAVIFNSLTAVEALIRRGGNLIHSSNCSPLGLFHCQMLQCWKFGSLLFVVNIWWTHAGVKMGVRDKSGNTALNHAKEKKYAEISSALRAAGEHKSCQWVQLG